jgi:hypothetical protein
MSYHTDGSFTFPVGAAGEEKKAEADNVKAS